MLVLAWKDDIAASDLKRQCNAPKSLMRPAAGRQIFRFANTTPPAAARHAATSGARDLRVVDADESPAR